MCNRLKAEREKVESVVREEFSERLVRLEEEAKSAKAELVEVSFVTFVLLFGKVLKLISDSYPMFSIAIPYGIKY